MSTQTSRLIPDSECKQGKCRCTTTGCYGKCALEMTPSIAMKVCTAPCAELQVELAAKESSCKELEAAKQRIADAESGAKLAEECQAIVQRINHEIIAEKEDLEKKMAEQQPDCARYARLRVLGAAPMDSLALSSGTVMRFQSLDAFIDEDIRAYGSRGEVTRTEELTKLLAAARAEGFEEGKQAGRDELQAEVDRLMLEFCPDEMTKEQIDKWEQCQRPQPPRRES